jgi:hypothetical protein
MLDEGNNNKIVFNWTKISPKIMDVVVPKWMIICWIQTKLGGKKMETRWRMMIMHAKHCRNGWIKDEEGENFLWSNFYFILFPRWPFDFVRWKSELWEC